MSDIQSDSVPGGRRCGSSTSSRSRSTRSASPTAPRSSRPSCARRDVDVRLRPRQELLPQCRTAPTSCSSSTRTSPRPGCAARRRATTRSSWTPCRTPGSQALRSRLSIPVLGPGQVQQHVGGDPRQAVHDPDDVAALGLSLYEKTMTEYGTATTAPRSARSTSGPTRSSCSRARRRSCSTALDERGASRRSRRTAPT